MSLLNLGKIYKYQNSNEMALVCFDRCNELAILIEMFDFMLTPEAKNVEFGLDLAAYIKKYIEEIKQKLSEKEFAKLESDIQANRAKYFKEATGIEEWKV